MRCASLIVVGITTVWLGALRSTGHAAPPAGSGLAIGPAQPQRKALGPTFGADLTAAAIDRFADAILDDDAGDLAGAIRAYKSSLSASKQAATHFNLADVYRRAEDFTRAIEQYRLYLALAPRAADRAAVEALVAKLAALPAIVVFDGREPGAVIYVDGIRVGTSPLVRQVATGAHVVERIGPRRYGRDVLEVRPGQRVHKSINDRAEDGPAGNVIIAGTRDAISGSWTVEGVRYQMNQRYTLPAGHYATSFGHTGDGCPLLAFDVAAAPALTHVYVVATPRGAASCQPFKVHQESIAIVDGVVK